MPTVVPPARDEISGTAPNPDSATARAGFGKLHDYLMNLLGSAGTAAAALIALGGSAIGRGVFTAATTSVAQDEIGGTATGKAVFISVSPLAARTSLGSGTVGDAVFTSVTSANARTQLGAGTTGGAIFTASTTNDAQTAIGAATFGKTLLGTSTANAAQQAIGLGAIFGVGSKFALDTNASGKSISIQMGSEVIATNVSGGGVIGFPQAFGTQCATVLFSIGDNNNGVISIVGIAGQTTHAYAGFQTNAPSSNVLVNWIAIGHNY
jgi:hypothetical protein